VELEMCLIKLCTRQIASKSLDNNLVYDKIKQADNSVTAENVHKESVAQPSTPTVDISQKSIKQLPEWADILSEFTKICPSVSGTLVGSTAYVYENVLLIEAKNRFFLRLFKEKENVAMLDKAVQAVLGKKYTMRARCKVNENDQKKADLLVEKAINSGIETAVE
jgi:DNA polymerase-3 subunit gamma/tau